MLFPCRLESPGWGKCSGIGEELDPFDRCAACCIWIVEPIGDSNQPDKPPVRKKRRWRRRIVVSLFVLAVLVGGARLALPSVLRWYVNRTIDQSPLYDGEIGGIDVHLWRGAYAIKDIRLNKTTGNLPVPLFSCKRVDLAIQWNALLAGEIVSRIEMEEPELNFVDGEEKGEDQSGSGGPWLKILNDLVPFRINSLAVRRGSIHLRAFAMDPPVDASLNDLEASIENLTNIHDELTPMVATVTATGLVFDQAKFEYQMKIDPASYHPSFDLAMRLIGLDVTKTNDLTRAYGSFDFEDGWFDLVVEIKSTEGRLEGYVKPLFRNLQVLNLKKDVPEDNVIQVFWEALIGGVSEVLENQPRNQFATVIPVTGDLTSPNTDIFATIGNVLRNAFVRAYMPRLQGVSEEVDGLQFGKGSVTDPATIGAAP